MRNFRNKEREKYPALVPIKPQPIEPYAARLRWHIMVLRAQLQIMSNRNRFLQDLVNRGRYQ